MEKFKMGVKTPDFMGSNARIIAEVRTKTCIDDVDAEVIKEILQYYLNEQCMMLAGYYEEEYYNAISSARNSGYSDGHSAV